MSPVRFSIPVHDADVVGQKEVSGFRIDIASHINKKDAANPEVYDVQSDSYMVSNAPHLPREGAMPAYLKNIVTLALDKTKRLMAKSFPLDENFRFAQDYEVPTDILPYGEDKRKFKEGELVCNGSTISIATISSEGILATAYIGDSPIRLFVIDSQTNEVTVHCPQGQYGEFDSNLHPTARKLWMHPEEPWQERNYGVAAAFHCNLESLKKNQNDRMFLVMGSDGVETVLGYNAEPDFNNVEKYKNEIGEALLAGENPSEWICQKARELDPETEDNMTVLATEIPPTHQNIELCVADGAGLKLECVMSAMLTRAVRKAINLTPQRLSHELESLSTGIAI